MDYPTETSRNNGYIGGRRFAADARRDDEGVLSAALRGGAAKQQPKDAPSLKRAGRFWAATASFALFVAQRLRLRPRSQVLLQNVSANVSIISRCLSKVSVVIPVRALGSGDIVLNSLKKADYPKELIETFVIEGDNPSYQRNEAIKKASGDIIFFFDDDSEIDPQLFKETIATYQKHPEVIGVGGPACLYGNTYFQKANIVILTSLLGVYKIRSRYSPVGKLRYTNENELISCNLSIKRDVFDKEQAFNERLYPNEENELVNRLLHKGYKFIYNPKCIVKRKTDTAIGQFIRRIFSYGSGRARQTVIAFSLNSLLRMFPLLFLLCLLFLFFTHQFYLIWPFYLYIIAVLFFSLYNSIRNPILLPLVFVLYIVTHLAYAFGEITGLVSSFCQKRDY